MVARANDQPNRAREEGIMTRHGTTAESLDQILARIAKVRADLRLLRRLKLPAADRKEIARLRKELDEVEKDAKETKRAWRKIRT